MWFTQRFYDYDMRDYPEAIILTFSVSSEYLNFAQILWLTPTIGSP
jgi:hypothetical protein